MKLPFLNNIPKWKIFPSVDTLGYFSPLGNFICLNEFEDENDFKKSIENPSLDKNRFSVYIHEYQHYIDQISTLWGVKKVYKIYESFDAVFKNDEFKFYKHRDLILNLKRDYFLDYYTVKYNHIEGDFQNRWKFQITSGLRFDYNGNINEECPIPFMSFASNNGDKISRVPISVVSLLETTATNAEFSFLISEAVKLASPHRENQIKAISKKLESKLYHPELTLYSAAVHLTSVNLEITDPIIGYKISSLFAKVALNLPSKLFSTITFPEELNSTPEWLKRSKKLIENQDRGFVFYLLIRNYTSTFGKLEGNNVLLEDILSSSKLPNEEEIEKLIKIEIEELDLKMLTGGNIFNRRIIDKTFFGNKFRESTGIGQNKKQGDLTAFIREKPYLIFENTYFDYEHLDLQKIYVKIASQQDVTIEEWFRLYTYCEKKIDDFNEICGI